MNNYRKAFIAGQLSTLGILAFVFYGSTIIYSVINPPKPEIEQKIVAQEKPARQERLSNEAAYPVLLEELAQTRLVYSYLHGSFPPMSERNSVQNPDNLPFYEDRNDFLKYNEMPISITFLSEDGSKGFQLSYSSILLPDAFGWFSGRNMICSAPTDEKEKVYQALADNFERGKAVDKTLINLLLRPATSDCDFFYEAWNPNNEKGNERIIQQKIKSMQASQKRMIPALEQEQLYDTIAGRDPTINPSEGIIFFHYYDALEEFLQHNDTPFQISFKGEYGMTSLAYGPPFVSNDSFLIKNSNGLYCVLADNETVKAWNDVWTKFENGRAIDLIALNTIIKGEVAHCTYPVG